MQFKNDGAPLTLAEQAAHRVIADRLIDSGQVTVSAEDLRLTAERYWLVDPLDGTKNFLAGNGEFTLNIALVYQGLSLLGVGFAPTIDKLYWEAKGMRTW